MTINQITGSHAGGIKLTPGNYGDPLTITQTGTVAGSIYGNTPWTVVNEGLISSPTYALSLEDGGSFNNSGTVSGTYFTLIYMTGGANLTNSGLIQNLGTPGSDALYLLHTSVSNAAGGTITGPIGILAAQGDDVGNAGLIEGASIGIQARYGITITNASTGIIQGGTTGIYAAGLDLTNDGTIDGQTGVLVTGAGTIDNSGQIEGGVFVGGGGTITNAAGGTIAGGGSYSVAGANYGLTLTNDGAVELGVNLGAGGTVTNAAGATIGGNVHAAGAVNLYNSGSIGGIVQASKGGTITNASGGSIGGGVDLTLGTVDNFGSIGGSGVTVASGAGFVNEATGMVSGAQEGLSVHGGNATAENAGIISGSTYAVLFVGYGYNNRLVIDPGAVFNGKVQFAPGYHYGGGGTYTGMLQLNSGVSNGTLSGLGGKYINFQGAEIEKGASWEITGTETGFSGQAIHGFNNADSLDITDLAFNSADTATVNASYQLVIADSGGTTLAAIQMDAGVAGDTFVLADDGHGGTFIDAPAVVQPNTTVSGLVAANGTSITVSSGGTAVGDGIGKGGTEIILAGGTASGTTLSGGGETVSGTAVSAVVSSGGFQTVASGGVASATKVLSGGEVVFAGGTVSGLTISSGGSAQAASGATVSSFTAGAGVTLTVLSGAVVSSATVQSGGKLILSGGTVDALTLLSGVTLSGITVASGANLTLSSGATASAVGVAGGGNENILHGAIARGGTVAGAQRVAGSAVGTIVGKGGSQTVTNGGTTTGTVIGAAGTAVVSSGGKSIGATVSSGGTERVLTGGTASAVAIKSGGTLVYGGGTITGATVASGGREAIAGGVTASSLSVGSGVTLIVSSGGTASKPAVVAGGTLADLGHTLGATVAGKLVSGKVVSGIESVAAKATASATTVNSGGVLIVSSGGAAFGTVLSGGRESVLSGGIVSGAVTMKGTGDTLSIGGAKPPALTVSGFVTGDTIDLTNFASKGAKLSFVENAGKTSGTLTITDGLLKATVILFGNHVATGFKLSAAGAGTAITYTSTTAAQEGLAVSHT